MSAELKPDIQLEIAHVLLIDVVGYSKLLVNEQVELLHELNRIVRSSECFQAAEAKEKLIRLPTGDGMALLFFRSPEQPVRCALQIGETLKNFAHIPVRMGLHSGPVNHVTDVNDRSNVAGAGINVAQRVLDCGDAGHILLSKHLADDVAQSGQWQPHLQDLGEYEVKHGLRLHIVNLCKDGVGNPSLPQRLQRRSRWKQPTASVRPVIAARWPRWAPAVALILSGLAVAFTVALFLRRPIPLKTAPVVTRAIIDKSIAVLPFDNLSDDKQNVYLADGIQDEILTDLAKVADLKVISRTSVMQFRNTAQRNLRDIANLLGVSHVLEGTVRRARNRIRVSAQLIDARTDTHVWGETYERDVEDVFAIENEVAEQIVGQLKSHLSANEKAAIEKKPTADLAAYDLYVRAKNLIERAVFSDQRNSLFEAVRLLEEAVKRDPTFGLAHYQLAHAHDQIYWFGFDRSPARLAAAQGSIEEVRRLLPDSGEAHLAIAKHLYWAYLDFDKARQELELARRTLPNDPVPYLLIGYIDRRQGRWEESIRGMERASELDPRNFFILQQISLTYKNLRRYADTAAVLDRAIKLAPTDPNLRLQRAEVELDSRADPKPLRAAIQAFRAANPRAISDIAETSLSLALCERDANAASQTLQELPRDGSFSYGKEGIAFPRSWCEGLVARLRGENAVAEAAFISARSQMEKTVHDEPASGPALCVLGMVDAALGRKKDAIREGRRALELLPPAKDAVDSAVLIQYLAVIYAWSGKNDAAFEQLNTAAKIPGNFTYGQLRLDPLWDPLRGDPRFDKILAELAPK